MKANVRITLIPLIACLCTGILFAREAPSQDSGQAPALLIRPEWTFRGTSDRLEQGIDILCIGNRIEAIGAGLEAPPGAKVIEGAGLCALPGLIDAHVHLDDGFLVSPVYLFPAWGVTTVRDLANHGRRIRGLEELIASGELLGPRIVYSGEAIMAGPLRSPNQISADDEETARSAVRSLAKQKVGFVLLMGDVPAPVARTVVEEATALGLPVSADLLESTRVNAMEAVTLGVRTLERLGGVPQALTLEGMKRPAPHLTALYDWLRLDKQKEDRLIAMIVEKGVFLIPTLASFERMALSAEQALAEGPENRSLPQTTWKSWKEQRAMQDQKPWWAPSCQLHLNYAGRFIGKAQKAGAKIVAGSGTPTPGLTPGWSLLREIDLLNKSGLTPAEALISATAVAADCLGRSKDLGTLEKGKMADILIVSGNPLDDLSALRKIVYVIKGGKSVNRGEIPGIEK